MVQKLNMLKMLRDSKVLSIVRISGGEPRQQGGWTPLHLATDNRSSPELLFALLQLLHLGDYTVYGLDHVLNMPADVLRSLHF